MRRTLLLGFILSLGTVLPGCVVRTAVVVAPPPPRYAVIGRAPGPGWVWTDGYWDRRGGGWFWVEGRWMRPPRPAAVWVPGRWVEVRPGHFVLQRGHWRR